jgi:site-specific DNA-methyltransferase (adenine-specific)
MSQPVIIGNATLYCGDCLDILPSLSGVDAVVTDPPYGIKDRPMLDLPGRGGRGNNDYHAASAWDDAIKPEWALECCCVAGVVAWFGHWRRRGEVEAAMKWPIRAEIIWSKDTHVGPPCPVAMRDERIWLFARDGIKGRTFETSVWDQPIIPTWAFKHHKNEKPVPLMRRLIEFIGGDVVCDPFMGSGTTGVAAVQSGRKFIGIEQDQEHFATACKRIEEAQRQADLFIAPAPKPVQEAIAL